MKMRPFNEFFKKATGTAPFLFQSKFAEDLPALVNVPTGLGKTAMAVIGWLWRRHADDSERRKTTPRRLVYCLPMRVLVEQTRDCAKKWTTTLHQQKLLIGEIPIHVLMGGEDEDDWDTHPERDAIIVGTQDMLLSRALNRGYAASRARWPMHFGLLNTDCLWVFDEIQLMGSGLATTAQLEAFRRMLPGTENGAVNHDGCRSVWMSATMQPDWLKTVDFKDRVDGLSCLKLSDDDHQNDQVKQRWNAKKPLSKATATMDDAASLAKEIRKAHKAGSRTIVVLNTVKRACALFEALKKNANGKKVAPQPSVETETSKPKIVLLHSRFRPEDRKQRVAEVLAEPPPEGTIVVSTQVIEAGVDVSATTLFTELAPWASLVQRFGRCNRRGEENELAKVCWIDLPDKKTDAGKMALPYMQADLESARDHLEKLSDAGLVSLDKLNIQLPFEHTHVIRRKDLIDLFDTTPDLAGNDIDIDRYVREIEETDVRVFWRRYYGEMPSESLPAPQRDELCPAPIGEFKDFAKTPKNKIWRWNFLEGKWEQANANSIAPGQVYLIHADTGGYSAEQGWNAKSNDPVKPAAPQAVTKGPDATGEEQLSKIGVWQTLAAHTDEVCSEIESILGALVISEATTLRAAARWHDWGKAHAVFQKALPDDAHDAAQSWAKAFGTWKRYGRRHFRHELASALAVLRADVPLGDGVDRNLVAYLIAAHHGKVRLSIRSLPGETRPPANNGASRRFARGVWDGDELPTVDLGGGVIAPKALLSLEPMELGLCQEELFKDQPSWAERMIGLRDTIGPFRLAYLEALLRAADMRASAKAETRDTKKEERHA